ncbi:MAG: transcriptional regulator [Desulfatitalea sp.]|nr:polyhydroxyalkanoate synthesis regulator DNA-binding domain-containing protein [Desulfatitalea sp.]NNK01850.1 transcriptional regulator [Desulfatitalea sp.]
MDEVVVLKKYANRRIYDTEKSAYVTLHEVAEYIRAGRMVSVEDAGTKEDVTAFILTQIVLEEAKKKNALLPVPLLHAIIRYGDNLMGEFFEKYFFQTFQNFIRHKQTMDDQFKQWLDMGINVSKMAQQSFSDISPFQPFFDSFAGKKKEGEEKK